jgi:hypothetical protein
MPSIKQVINSFKSTPNQSSNTQGNIGYDNPRQVIDPQIRTQSVNSKEIVANKFRLLSGASVNGLVLTADTNGNGIWKTAAGAVSIGGNVTNGTDKSVIFISGTSLAQDPSLFYWDYNNRNLVIENSGSGEANLVLSGTTAILKIATKNGSVNASTSINFVGQRGTGNANWYIGTNDNGGGLSDGSGSADDFYFYKNAGTTGTKLIIKDNGNIGIGVKNPSKKLDVVGTASISGATRISGSGFIRDGLIIGANPNGFSGYDLAVTNQNGGFGIITNSGNKTKFYTVTDGDFEFQTNGQSPGVYFAISGAIGIKTLSPREMLDVIGNANVTGYVSAGSLRAANGYTGDATDGDVAHFVNGICTGIN